MNTATAWETRRSLFLTEAEEVRSKKYQEGRETNIIASLALIYQLITAEDVEFLKRFIAIGFPVSAVRKMLVNLATTRVAQN
jgi:hypothetical protein